MGDWIVSGARKGIGANEEMEFGVDGIQIPFVL